MKTLGLPMIAPLHFDEKGRISCDQATDTMKTKASIENGSGLRVVMATLCHYQCDSKAS